MLRYIAIGLMAAACGTDLMVVKKTYQHKDLKPYVDLFYQDAAKYGRKAKNNVSFYMAKAPLHKEHPTSVGMCFVSKNSLYAPYVLIQEEYWKKASYLERKAVIYHELAHCSLRLGHVEKHPSLIFPNVYGEPYLAVWMDKMIEDLFTNNGIPTKIGEDR